MIYFVLDTNVLLSEGKQALYQFEDNHVVIPMVVLSELDNKKTDPELGRTARSVTKEIRDKLQQTVGNNWASLGDGFGDLIVVSPLPFDGEFIPVNADGDILRTAMTVKQDHPGEEVIIVTKDTMFGVISTLNGFETMELTVPERTEVDRHIRKVETFNITHEQFDELYREGKVKLPPEDYNIPRNVGVILLSPTGGSALAISDTQYDFRLVRDNKDSPRQGRNAEQRLALSVLGDRNVGVVSLTGPAGSGKSFLALAQAIADVRSNHSPIDKVIVYRPINAVGGSQQELGFLPGTIDEKMAPHVEAVQDTLEALENKVDAEKLLKYGTVKVDSVSFVRGRTIANTAIIVEEAQNLEYATLLTLLTRAGAGSRVFLVWDMSQRDNQYINKHDGVYRVVKKLLGHRLFAHVPFSKSERSDISSMAVDLLDEL